MPLRRLRSTVGRRAAWVAVLAALALSGKTTVLRIANVNGYLVKSTTSRPLGWNQASAFVELPTVTVAPAAIGNDVGYVMYGVRTGRGYATDIGLQYADGLRGLRDGWHAFYCVQRPGRRGDHCHTDPATVAVRNPYMLLSVENDGLRLTVIDPSGWRTLASIMARSADAGWNRHGSAIEISREVTIAQVTPRWADGTWLRTARWSQAYLYRPQAGFEQPTEWTAAQTSQVDTCPARVTAREGNPYSADVASIHLDSTAPCT